VAHGDDQREAILQATYACISRWGLKRTSLEDAAKEAGVSRATLYRYFGGREQLLNAVVAWEYGRFFDRLIVAVAGASTLTEVMEMGLVAAHRAIAEHEVLQMVLQTEPALLEPTFAEVGSTTRAQVAAFLRPYVDATPLAAGIEASTASDYLARMFLSYMGAPGRWDLDDANQVRSLVEYELLGGIVAVPA
jgi:AcrR family transcriptional regulator